MELPLTYRLAEEADLPALVDLLFDDPLGATRERPETVLSEAYRNAFALIRSDPNQELTLVELKGEIVGTFQLTFIQYLTHQGGRRAQVEAVRVASRWRGRGIGKEMFAYVRKRALEKGCHLLQLTTDKRRPEALRFYQALGYVATHEGLKLVL